MPLTIEEVQRVAELKHDIGYRYLMAAIQTSVDNAANCLLDCPVEDETRLLARWRAMKEVHSILVTAPEDFALNLAHNIQVEEQVKGPSMPNRFKPSRSPLSSAEQEALRKVYIQKFGKDLDGNMV